MHVIYGVVMRKFREHCNVVLALALCTIRAFYNYSVHACSPCATAMGNAGYCGLVLVRIICILALAINDLYLMLKYFRVVLTTGDVVTFFIP